jgi:putative photosynthetic complex assembly protein 2
MCSYFWPALYAVAIWWFSTGLILYLDSLPGRTFRWSMLGGTTVFLLALYQLGAGSNDTSVAGAYVGFTCGILLWGWQEMTFFMGQISGPMKTASRARPGSLRHFRDGVATSLYHELAIVVCAAVVVWFTWGAPNQLGRWTFLLLWAMRQSAKLNLFLGVLNLSDELLPERLGYLRSYMARKPMNLLFPVSVSTGTVLAVVLVQRAGLPGIQPQQAAGLTMLITLLVLGIVEHWFLMLPLPLAPLWTWLLRSFRNPEPLASMPARPPQDAARHLGEYGGACLRRPVQAATGP